MIRPLRQRHRRMLMVLGVILPVAFAVGIAARKPVPSMISVPDELGASPRRFGVTEWERTDLFTNPPIQVRLLRESAGGGGFAVEFSAAPAFVKPDLIVYWVAGSQTVTGRLPDDARLVGTFTPSVAVSLAPVAGPGSGVLVLYSLADQEIVAVSKPFALPKP